MTFKLFLKGNKETPRKLHPLEQPSITYIVRYLFKDGQSNKTGLHYVFAENQKEADLKAVKSIKDFGGVKLLDCKHSSLYTYNPKTKQYTLKPMMNEV